MKPWLAARNLAALAVRRTSKAAERLSIGRKLARRRLRHDRRREQAALAGAEQKVLREIRELARGTRPIVVGPWCAEVGYEILYWVPFVRWLAHEHRVSPDRLAVVSRGGVGGWYGDVAAHYADIFDLMPVEEFALRNQRRIADDGGSQKPLATGHLDEEILIKARGALSLRDAAVCHPSLMYRLLRQFWAGNRSLEFALDRLRYAPPAAAPVTLPELPERFTAVKLYTARALPDTPANRALLRAWIQRLARREPVVLLSSPPAVDDHADFSFESADRVIALAGMTPANNLALQTAVLRKASSFVSTCGGLAWLAPLMGVPTTALYSDDAFLGTHLYVARQAYRQVSGAGTFAVVDVRGLA